MAEEGLAVGLPRGMAKRRFGAKVSARAAIYRGDSAYDDDDRDNDEAAVVAVAEGLRRGVQMAGRTKRVTCDPQVPAILPLQFLEVVAAWGAGVREAMAPLVAG